MSGLRWEGGREAKERDRLIRVITLCEKMMLCKFSSLVNLHVENGDAAGPCVSLASKNPAVPATDRGLGSPEAAASPSAS